MSEKPKHKKPAEPLGSPPPVEPVLVVAAPQPVADIGASLYRDKSGPVRETSPTEGAANFSSAMGALHPHTPPEAA